MILANFSFGATARVILALGLAIAVKGDCELV